jgi:hypothetical protein
VTISTFSSQFSFDPRKRLKREIAGFIPAPDRITDRKRAPEIRSSLIINVPVP